MNPKRSFILLDGKSTTPPRSSRDSWRCGTAPLVLQVIICPHEMFRRLFALSLLAVAQASAATPAPKLAALAQQVRDFVQRGEHAKGLYALQEIEQTDPALFTLNNYHFLAGVTALREGKLDTAAAYLKQSLAASDLADYSAWYLAEVASREGNAAARIGWLDRVVASRGSLLADDAAYARATTHLSAGDFSRALADLSSTHLAARDLTYEKVQCLLGLGRGADAARLVSDTLRRKKKSDSLLRALGLIELKESDEDVRALSSQEIRLRGDLYYSNRAFDRALFYFRILNEERGDRTDDLLYSIGRALDNSGDKAGALAWFEKAETEVGSKYRYWTIWFQAEILFKRQDLASAEARYKRALPLAPGTQNDLSTRLRILACQELTGQRDRAAETTREILRAHSSMFYQMKFRGVKSLVAEGKFADAIAQVDALIASESAARRPELLFWKGWLYERLGKPADASAIYDSILRQHITSFHAILATERFADRTSMLDASGFEQRLEAARAIPSNRSEEARKELTYLFHRYPAHRPDVSRELAALYQRTPRYRDIISMAPIPARDLLTARPAAGARTTAGELAFLGFYADAAVEMDAARGRRTSSPAVLLTIADYYHLGGMPHSAMLRAESLTSLMPRDYEFELLPRRLQELLYPVNYTSIVDKYAPADLDLALFFSLVREESRFNTFARSGAGARGLLQFIPSTAWIVLKEIGGTSLREEDLYDPDLAIKLGTYYIAKLSRMYSQAPAPLLASYNAGEEQGKLWLRMAGTGELHRYLSEVNYPETRNYIMKIMTSYSRYRAVYPELTAYRNARSPATAGAPGTAAAPPAPQ